MIINHGLPGFPVLGAPEKESAIRPEIVVHLEGDLKIAKLLVRDDDAAVSWDILATRNCPVFHDPSTTGLVLTCGAMPSLAADMPALEGFAVENGGKAVLFRRPGRLGGKQRKDRQPTEMGDSMNAHSFESFVVRTLVVKPTYRVQEQMWSDFHDLRLSHSNPDLYAARMPSAKIKPPSANTCLQVAGLSRNRNLRRSLLWSVLSLISLVPTQPAAPALLSRPMHYSTYLRDHTETRGFTLGRPTHAQPTPSGDAVLFLRSGARSARLELFEYIIPTGETRLLLTPDDILKGEVEHLSPEEKALRERKRVSTRGFTDFQLSKDGRKILLGLSGKLYLVDRSTRAVTQLKTSKPSPVDAKFSPDGRKIAYVLEHDVYVCDLASTKEERLTSGGTEEISHGLAEFVAREEMDRFSGFWWSADSSAIIYQETDVRAVETWYVSDPAKPEVAPYPSRYPRPGKANATVRLGVIPLGGRETVWLGWDHARYPYLASVHADAEGPLCLTVQTRDQKELVLLAADLTTGATRVLLTEHDSDWVSLRQDVPRWIAKNRGFLWVHEKPGAGCQLEWRRADGQLEKLLVPANFGFKSLIDIDANGGSVVFSARTDPTQWKLFQLPLNDSSPRELTPQSGCHHGTFDEHHTIFVDTRTDLQQLARATVYRIDGTPLGELPTVAEEPPFTPRVELAHVGGEPGYYAAVVRPAEFDPARRYPVIVYVYGGPLAPWSSGTVVASESSWLMPQWIANQGFIVVSIDGRGTPGRGHDWERAIAKRFGSVPLADQISGLRALGERFPELDLERVGIYGWSFGGYMAALAVLKEPGVFKAGVAGAPPTDWYDYDTHYTERYLGVPPVDADAYDAASLLPLAGGLTRPLLLVHGTGDDNVYFRHTLRLIDALFRAGKSCDSLPLSGLTHMVPDPVVNEQLYTRIVRYFQQHLIP